MNSITSFLILKSLDILIEFLRKEKIPEKIMQKIIEKINTIESIIFKWKY